MATPVNWSVMFAFQNTRHEPRQEPPPILPTCHSSWDIFKGGDRVHDPIECTDLYKVRGSHGMHQVVTQNLIERNVEAAAETGAKWL